MVRYYKSTASKVKRSGAFLFLFRSIFISCALAISGISSQAQDISDIRDSLKILFNRMQDRAWKREVVDSANNKIVPLLDEFLKLDNNYTERLTEIKTLSDLVSEDQKLRLVTWSLPPQNGIYQCFGFVVKRDPKENSVKVFKLQAQQSKNEKLSATAFKTDNWPSCVYYYIVLKKYKKKEYYTLLGWNGNDGITTIKSIDILTFSDKGEPVFGAPVFQLGKKKQYRMLFEYNPQAVMFLNYNHPNKLIVFDHLSPSDPTKKGQFQYYGPDMSVDALRFKKGMWLLKEDLDAKNLN